MNRKPTKFAFNRPSFFPLKVVLAILAGVINVPETDAEDRELPPTAVERFIASKQSNSVRAAGAPAPEAPFPGSWMAATPYPINISRYAFVQNGEDIYVISGFTSSGNTDAVNRYNATTNTWTPLAPIPTKSQAPCAAYYDGKIYVADGNAGPGFQIYDIATNTWSAGPPRPGVTDSFGAAAAAYIGKVYIAGGQTTGGITTTSIYNTSSNTWSVGPPAPAPVHFGGYTQVNQFLYVIGGTGPGSPANNINVSMRLDMTNDTWSTGPTWTPARQDFALAAAGTKLFAIGGDTDGGTFFNASTQVDELETSTWPAGTWMTSPNLLPSARQGNQAGFFSTGRVGGEIWSTGGFNPATAEHLCRAVPCVITFQGAIGSNSSTYPGVSGMQTNRISRARDPSTCSTSPAFTQQPGSFTFDSYVFTNKGPATCVTFTLDTACRGTQEIFAVAYTGSFNPANVATNHAGDMGRSLPFSNNFSVNVPANGNVILVVSEVVSGGGCPDYKVTVNGLGCVCAGARVLIPYGDTGAAPTQLQIALQAQPGIVVVDLFNANTGTPTLAQLQQYDLVAPLAFSAFMNPVTLGNNLADYVDGGGVVVQLGLSYSQFGSRNITGRWTTDGYAPYTYSSSTSSLTHFLGTFDTNHPLMQGVTALQSNSRSIVTPAAGATQVAAWDDNVSLIAVKPVGNHTTVGITAYIGAQATWSGSFARVLANAVRWLNGCSTINISGNVAYCAGSPRPVHNVTLNLTGSTTTSTLSDGSGNYQFSSLASGETYNVTPTKSALAPGSAGITGVDAVATQRHFLNLGTPLSGCQLAAAEVTGNTVVDGVDAVAIQRFFLGLTTGIANVGKYQFNPASRTYSGTATNQTGQNYDAYVFGDVNGDLARPVSGPAGNTPAF